MIFVRAISWFLISAISTYKFIMLVRAICSWIPPVRESKFFWFLRLLTEPLISPIRKLLNRVSWIRRCPIDLSFLALYLLLEFASSLLSTLLTYYSYSY